MGFETVVRPAVFPNIRPPAARALAIEDAPDKGLAVITGGGVSGVINLPHSESHSWTRTRVVEVKRHFSKARIYYTRPDGTLDYSKYWEFEVLTAIEYLENGQTSWGQQFAKPFEAANIKVIQHGLTRENK